MPDNKKTDNSKREPGNTALTVDEARTAIVNMIPVTGRTVTVPLDKAAGCVSSSDG